MRISHRRPFRLLSRDRLPEPVTAPFIRTERLVLRSHRLSDAERWFELQSAPEVRRQMWLWPMRDREQSRIHLRHRTRHTRLHHVDDFLALAIERRGELIGDVSLHLRAARDLRVVELGWVLHPDATGHGYALEASRALRDFAFDELGAHLATCQIRLTNEASLRLANRLGFREAAREGDIVTLMMGADERQSSSPVIALHEARAGESASAQKRALVGCSASQ